MPRYTKVTGRSGSVVTSLVLAALVWSCSSKKMGMADEVQMDQAPLPLSGSDAAATDRAATATTLADQDREMLQLAQGDPRARLIQSEADLTIQTDHQDSLHRRLVRQTEVFGGYVVQSTRQRTQVRIPATDFDILLADMETWGKVSRREIKGADVTDSFRDFRLELDNAERRRTRLLELLDRTEDVDAKLRIEAELERASLQVDLLTARLAALRHNLKFTTVTMETTKPDKDWKPGYVLEGLGLVFKGVRSLLVIR